MNSGLRRVVRRIRFQVARASDRSIFLVAIGLCLIGTVWSFVDYTHVRVPSVAIILLVFGSLILSGRSMIALVIVLTACIVAVLAYHGDVSSQLSLSGVLMLVAVALVSIVQTVRRDALGLHRTSAESILESVGSQLRTQGRVPALPAGWNVDVAQHTAFGAPFAGDFISSRVYERAGESFLDLVLVDVSGRGIEAGSRALLFSGAIGGLLGEVAPEQFLAGANQYLIRQRSEDGFSSATYVHVSLSTGAYQLRSAGHPPVLVWNAAERASHRAQATGIVLGVVPDLELVPTIGTLGPGDALVLYTDGIVELRTSDLESGISAMEQRLERVERLRGSRRLAEDLLAAAHGSDDDQTVVVIRFEPQGEPVTPARGGEESAVTPGPEAAVAPAESTVALAEESAVIGR
jgi:hypothetical protein